jgi:hypothetical protein
MNCIIIVPASQFTRDVVVLQASVLDSFLAHVLKVCRSMLHLEQLFETLFSIFSKTIVWTIRYVIMFIIFSRSDFQQISIIVDLGTQPLSLLLTVLAHSASAQLIAEIREWQRVRFLVI